MPDDPRQVEIEIALRDTTSSVLKDISKNIDEISRKLVETGRKGSEAFDKIKHSADQSSDGTKGATGHISSLTDHMGKLGQTLRGPIGLAAGFAATAIAMERFIGRAATSRLQLQLMTKDLGVSAEFISKFQQTLSRKGITDAGEQKRIMTQFFGEAMDLKTRGVYSDFWERLQRFDPKFARSFKSSVDKGDIAQSWEKAKNMYADLIKLGRPDQARYFATETLHLAESTIANWDEYAKGVTAARQLGEKEAKAAAVAAAEASKIANSEIQFQLERSINKLLEWEKAVGSATKKAEEVQKVVPPVETTPKGGGGTTPGGSFKNRFPGPSEFSPTPGTGSGTVPQIQINPRPGYYQGGSLEDDVLPAHAKPVMFRRELLTNEKEANKDLAEIRDLLDLMLHPPDAGGAAPGLTFRRGIRTGTGNQGGRGGVGSSGGASMGPGSIGALGGTVHGYGVDAYGGQTGKTLFDPMTGTLGGGLGGHSAMFGPGQHMGIDIMGPIGSRVHAIKDGVVERVPHQGGGTDQVLTIKHADGTYTRYLHQGYLPGVYVGKPVAGGEVVGSSGHRNADHSHVEFWVGPPGAHGSKLANLRAIMGWDKNNLPKGGTPRTGRGPLPITPPPLPPSISKDFKGVTGRASWFNDRTTASGLPAGTPGFAIRSSGTIGGSFIVRDETTGKEIVARQTDWGPHIRTGRNVDINAELAKQFGYPDEKHFPTGHIFSVRPIDSELNKGGAAGKTSSRRGHVKATVDFAGMAKRARMAGNQPFKSLKITSGRQGQTVHAGSVLPGDVDHSRWTV